MDIKLELGLAIISLPVWYKNCPLVVSTPVSPDAESVGFVPCGIVNRQVAQTKICAADVTENKVALLEEATTKEGKVLLPTTFKTACGVLVPMPTFPFITDKLTPLPATFAPLFMVKPYWFQTPLYAPFTDM